MSADSGKIFDAITDFVDATVDYELAHRDQSHGYPTSTTDARIRRDKARRVLHDTLREELDP